jgi:hypothetical protein
MTLNEVRRSEKLFLTPTDIAPILGVHPYSINLQAQDDPAKLGFPVVVIRRRVKIPRLRFLEWIGGEKNELLHNTRGTRDLDRLG